MNAIELINRSDPYFLAIWAVIISIAFVMMLVGCIRCIKFLQAYRRDLITRIKSRRIHKMLSRLGINIPRFIRKAHRTDVEKHLFICQQCPNTEVCDAYFEKGKAIDEKGKAIDETSFCGNYQKLVRFSRHRQNT